MSALEMMKLKPVSLVHVFTYEGILVMSQFNNNNRRRPTAIAIPDPFDPTNPNFLLAVLLGLNLILWLFVVYRTLTWA